jgi:hypothetical protein
LKIFFLFEVGFRFGKPKPFANKVFLRGFKNRFFINPFLENAIWRRPLFSRFSKTQTKGLKHLFTKHFGIWCKVFKTFEIGQEF